MGDTPSANNDRAMLHFKPAPLPLILALLGFAACGSEDPVEPEPERPPDLTGTYTLESLLSGLITGGQALTPPEVSGTFTAQQTSVTGGDASGTTTFSLILPDGRGGTAPISDQGTYVNRLDGTWEQAGALLQGIGTYTLRGDVLTVD